MKVSQVLPEQVDAIWPQVEDKVRRAIKVTHTDVSPDYMREAAKRGESVLWAVHEGERIIAILALRVLVNRENGGKTVNVDLIAGEKLNEWAETMQKLLEDYRDLVGARCIQADVRDGMTKILKSYGWRRITTKMEFNHGR